MYMIYATDSPVLVRLWVRLVWSVNEKCFLYFQVAIFDVRTMKGQSCIKFIRFSQLFCSFHFIYYYLKCLCHLVYNSSIQLEMDFPWRRPRFTFCNGENFLICMIKDYYLFKSSSWMDITTNLNRISFSRFACAAHTDDNHHNVGRWENANTNGMWNHLMRYHLVLCQQMNACETLEIRRKKTRKQHTWTFVLAMRITLQWIFQKSTSHVSLCNHINVYLKSHNGMRCIREVDPHLHCFNIQNMNKRLLLARFLWDFHFSGE